MRLAIFIAVFANTIFAGVAAAQSLWNHNGSVVQLEARGAERQFYYLNPRPGLPVPPKALLFRGRKTGDQYSGTAYVFSTRCGSSGYPVQGVVGMDQRTVTMYGQAPLRDQNCRVTGHRADTLVFTFRDAREDSTDAGFKLTVGKDGGSCHIPMTFRWRSISGRMSQDEHFVLMLEDERDDLCSK